MFVSFLKKELMKELTSVLISVVDIDVFPPIERLSYGQ